MSFLLDLICIAIVVGVALSCRTRPISSVLFSLLSLMAALVAGAFLTKPAAALLSNHVVQPLMENTIAGELADMFSAPHLSTGKDTVQELPVEELLIKRPVAFDKLLAKYGADYDSVRAAYTQSPEPYTLLMSIAGGFSLGLSSGAAFFTLFLFLLLLARFITRRIEENLPPPKRVKGFRRSLPLLAGVLYGIGFVWALVLLLEWIVPYLSGVTLFFDTNSLLQTNIYAFFKKFHPIIPLLF